MNGELERPLEAVERLNAANKEAYKVAVDHAFEAQKSGLKLSRAFFENWVETLEDGAEINRRALEDLRRIVAEQREVFFHLSHDSLNAYDDFVDSLSLYEAEVSGERPAERES